MTTAFLFIVLFLMLMLGAPVAIALGFSSVVTIMLFGQDSLASLAIKLFQTSEQYTLMAIPFFLLSGAFLTTGGVARRLIQFANDCVGHIRGGLGIASVFACMLFAAVSGSSPATVVAVGSIAIAGMVRSGYSKEFAAGLICNAGTLGILIPPSIPMVVYAAATESSVGRMFAAGFLPGTILGLMLMVAIYIIACMKNLPALPWPGFQQIARSTLGAIWGLVLIVVILGGIYGGVFTPTEAAAVAAVYAVAVAVFIYRDIGPLKDRPWRKPGEGAGALVARNTGLALTAFVRLPADLDVRRVFVEAGKMTVMLMFIIANAVLFGHVLTTERIPHLIAEGIIGAGMQPWMFLVVVNIILLIAGNFMEPSAIILIAAPILFPIAMQLGIDPVHFGIIMVVNMDIGMITPPVGLNLFVTSAVTGMPIVNVLRAALPWLAILFAFLVLVTYVPIISTVLPDYFFGPDTSLARPR